jgi:tetratricopeptide (TPR) repeat protein
MNVPLTLDQLENAQLLRPLVEAEPAYAFRHTLTQESAYASLLKHQRREIHRAVAQAYEKIYGDRCTDEFAAILARHYSEAGDAEQTLVYAAHAGDAAARIYANTEAISFYTQALDLAKPRAENTPQLISLYTRLGRAYELSENYPRALELYHAMQTLAQTRSDRALELQALMLQATAYAVGTGGVRDLSKAQEISMQGLELAQALADRPAQARLYWILLLVNRFGNLGPAQAVEYGEKSLALARELGLTEQIAFTLNDLTSAYRGTGQFDLGYAIVPQVTALWRKLNNLPMLAEALMASSVSSLMQGQLDESIQQGVESYRLNASIGNRYGLSLTGGFLWYTYRELGQLQRAIELAEESTALAKEAKFYGPYWSTLVDLAATFDWLGDYGRAAEYAQRALSNLIPDSPAHPIFPSSVFASIALHQGDLAKSVEWLAPFIANSLDEYVRTYIPSGIQLFSTVIELALAQKDAPRALAIADHTLALFSQLRLVIALPSILHSRARALRLLDRADEAYTLLIDARRQAEAMQSRYRLLPILFTLVEMETERGAAAQSERIRLQAHEVVDYIVGHLPAELLQSFLNLPDVRKVMNA